MSNVTFCEYNKGSDDVSSLFLLQLLGTKIGLKSVGLWNRTNRKLPNFRYFLPLAASVNPGTGYLRLVTLARAKWTQVGGLQKSKIQAINSQTQDANIKIVNVENTKHYFDLRRSPKEEWCWAPILRSQEITEFDFLWIINDMYNVWIGILWSREIKELFWHKILFPIPIYFGILFCLG